MILIGWPEAAFPVFELFSPASPPAGGEFFFQLLAPGECLETPHRGETLEPRDPEEKQEALPLVWAQTPPLPMPERAAVLNAELPPSAVRAPREALPAAAAWRPPVAFAARITAEVQPLATGRGLPRVGPAVERRVEAETQPAALSPAPQPASFTPPRAESPAEVQPLSPSPPEATPEEPARQFDLKVGEARDRVEVRVEERAGELRVTVRAPDAELRDGLQARLPELVGRLEAGGYQAEVRRSAEAQQPGRQDGGSSREGGQEARDPRDGRRNRRDWNEEIRRHMQ